MGYETRMYIAQIRHDIMTPMDIDGYLHWASIIGMIDLCKVGYNSSISNLIQKQTTKEPVVFMYGSDGNSKIYKDDYDEALGIISITDMIEAINMDISDDKNPYRRLVIAREMLLSVMDSFDLDTTFVVTYGH